MDNLVFLMNRVNGFDDVADVVSVHRLSCDAEEASLVPKLPSFKAVHLQEKVQFILEGLPQSDCVFAL